MYSVIPTVVLRSPVLWRLVPNFHINVQGWDSSYCSHLINLRIQLFFFLKAEYQKVPGFQSIAGAETLGTRACYSPLNSSVKAPLAVRSQQPTLFPEIKGHHAIISCNMGSPGRLICRCLLGVLLGLMPMEAKGRK